MTGTQIVPFGGKVPLTVSFSAEVDFQFPELISGATVEWDIDGQPGVDATVGVDETLKFKYNDCTNVTVTATPVDRFGEPGNTVERLLRLSCNRRPVIEQWVAIGPNGPATGRPGTRIQFRFAASDPDWDDPDLESGNGIDRFEFDWDGDGTFEQNVDGRLQSLPQFHTYDVVGIYRPVIRAYDGDGDFTDSAPELVSIFADLEDRGRIQTTAEPRALAVPEFAGAPATSVVMGLGPMGYGWAARYDGAGRFMYRGGQQYPGDVDAVEDILVVGDAAIGADRRLGMVLWDAADPERPVRLDCTLEPAKPDRMVASRFHDGVTDVFRLAVRNASNDRWYLVDGTPLLGGIQAGEGCDDHLSEFGSNALLRDAVPFGDGFQVGDVAAMAAWVYASVTTFGAGGSAVGVAAYPLTDPAAAPVCAVTDAGCIATLAAPTALAAAPGGTYTTGLIGGRPGPAGERWFDLPRYTVDAAAAVDEAGALWVDGVAHGPATDTWWFASPSTMAMATTFYTTTVTPATSAVTMAAQAEDLLAAGFGNELHIYAVTTATGRPAYSVRATAAVTSAVDAIAVRGRRIAWADRSGAYDGTAPTFHRRQPRGAYVAETTALTAAARVLPSRWAFMDDEDYAGPADMVFDGGLGLWVADMEDGVYWSDTTAVSALAAAGSPVTAAAPADRQLRLAGKYKRLQGSGNSAVAYASMGPAGAFRVNYGDAENPQFDWALPTTDKIDHAVGLPAAGGRPELVAAAEPNRLRLLRTDTPAADLEAYHPPAGYRLDHLRMIPDPDSRAHAIVYTGEVGPNDTVAYQMVGVLNDLTFADGVASVDPGNADDRRWFRVPDDFSGNGADTVMNPLAPALGDVAAGDIDRVAFFDGPGNNHDRFCIEAYWGESCLGGKELLSGNQAGIPLAAQSHGERLGVFYDLGSKSMAFLGPDGQIFAEKYSLCADLPSAGERQACLVESTLKGTAIADPYWVVTTRYGLFVVDLRDPQRPQLLTRASGDYEEVDAWFDGTDLHILAARAAGDNLQIRTVRDLAFDDE